MDTPRSQEDHIRERAYGLWQADGCPDGCAEQHWLQAESGLRTAGDADMPARNASAAEIQGDSQTSDAPGVQGRSGRRA